MEGYTQALVWTFIQSLWLGLVAGVLAAIIIWATPKSSAKLRYNLLLFILLLFVVSTSFVFVGELAPGSETTTGVLSNEKAAFAGEQETSNSKIGLAIRAGNWIDANAFALGLAWIFFFLIRIAHLLIGLSTTRRLRTKQIHGVPADWQERFENLKQQLGIQKKISLLQSALVKVPVAIGHFRPVILLPLGLMSNLPVQQVEAIIIHELAHIRRKDFLVNIFQHLIEAMFFFNPAILWISSLIRQEREACCDDMVLDYTVEKTTYLSALVSFGEYSVNSNHYALAVSTRKQTLYVRVKRMVTNENRRLSGFEKVGLFSALVLFSAFTLLKEGGNTATPVIPQVKKPLITISKIEERPPATATKQVPKVTVAKTGKTRKKPVPVEKTSIASPKQEAVHIVVSPKMSILKDTLPRKIQEDPVTAFKPNREPLESEKVLAEIIRIKEEIGENKASIGRRKAQLEQQPEKEKEIMGRITEEREEIEKKRLKLDNLRVRLAKLRKQEEREQKRK